MWSVGCILAELLGGTTLFKGKDYVDQLNEILKVLGTPSEETIQSISSSKAQYYVRTLPYMPVIPFQVKFPNATPLSIDLLTKMLTLDPRHRISVEDALEHPYLEIWHDPNDEPVCAKKFDFSFEEVDDLAEMRQVMIDEVQSFREYVRKPLEEQEIVSDNYAEQQQQQQAEAQEQQQLMQQQQQQQQDMIYQQQMAQVQAQQQAAMAGMLAPPTTTGLMNLGNDDYELPPRPEEMSNLFNTDTITDSDTVPTNLTDADTLNLEQELQFGLDGFNFHG
ncbi:unnamed protein product [Ambrosiozyma monospora]|uniref:Unnamed protein product n=1 Tax=Ambrosiozyma monospora TaxID=43982 RepID=A0ACB5TYX7_AMBMO|nr:unnamed protein product [Ambrosiozyma monospora]